MYKNLFPKTLLLAGLTLASTCWAGLSFELTNSINFTKINTTTADLDKKNFKGTAATSSWRSSRELLTYLINGELIYSDSTVPLYGKVAANYGWVVGGKEFEYPRRWDTHGYEKGFNLETGYIMNINKRLDFIPHVGFEYDIYKTRINHQHFTHRNPTSFVSQNGNKSSTTLYYPYIGVEFDFTSNFDVQFSTTYELGWVRGHGKDSVTHGIIITDDPNTSRYGSRTKYRDLLSHYFEVTASYAITNKWQIGLDLDYQIIYNTHRLPVKLQRNHEIVETGQFTPSQFHAVTDYVSQNYGIILSVVYTFFGGEGAYVR